jgi:hypothetical protein
MEVATNKNPQSVSRFTWERSAIVRVFFFGIVGKVKQVK